MKKIIIIGAGDGGRVISELIKQQGGFKLAGFLDDNKELQGRLVNGYKVIGRVAHLNKFRGMQFVVSVGGDLKARSRIFQSAVKAGLEPVSLVHKAAIVDKTANIGKGSIILARCVVGPFAKIGENVFLFSGTIIEHDDFIESNVYASPGVCLAGKVRVGKNTFLGIRSCVVQGVKIGSNVIVGAGSVVLKDVADNTVVAGIPAKVLRKNE